jgi:lysophospholipase L1-like esterase
VHGLLALGDSYTIGEGVEPADRWPSQLVRRLQQHDVELPEPTIIARTGWTTDELANAIAQAPPAGDHQLTTLLIGVNDQYRGRTLQSFEAGFAALLDRAVGFASGDPAHVIALSIPDWGVTPFAEGRDQPAIAEQIDAFNAAALARARHVGASWMDVTDSSRAMGTLPALVAADGLHPSAELYRRWVEMLLPLARRVLAR